MPVDVLCLRPEADFARVGALPPAVARGELCQARRSRAGAAHQGVGRRWSFRRSAPKLPAALFEGCTLALVQVTGAGVDRLDQAALTRLGIPVANVAGAQQRRGRRIRRDVSARCCCGAWPGRARRSAHGNYVAFRARMLADNLAGLDGLLVGIVGFGIIGLAVARAFHGMGCRICFHDPAPRDLGATQALCAQSMPLPELLAARRRGDAACAADPRDARPDRRRASSRR